SSRRLHTRSKRDWSSDVCSSDLYHLQVSQPGFAPAAQDVSVRSAVTVPIKVTLSVAGISETVQVEAGGQDILENVPYAHADVNKIGRASCRERVLNAMGAVVVMC